MKGQAESRARAGSCALSLLASPINVQVMQSLAEGSRSLVDLRREAGSPPQTTMRGHVKALSETGALTRRRRNDFPGSLDYELTASGRDLVAVVEALQDWLAVAPDVPLTVGSAAAKSAIKALVEGWDTGMVRALAAKPISLTKLNSVLPDLNYPSLERRLAAMRLVGQLEARPSGNRGTPYAATRWLRQAVGPLAAAARWERLHLAEAAAPIARQDAETALLLAAPLLDLPQDLSGACRLGVEVQNGTGKRLVGVLVSVEEGRIASCVSQLQGDVSAWACGSAQSWLQAVIEHDLTRLELGGDSRLVGALLDGLRGALFGAPQSA